MTNEEARKVDDEIKESERVLKDSLIRLAEMLDQKSRNWMERDIARIKKHPKDVGDFVYIGSFSDHGMPIPMPDKKG